MELINWARQGKNGKQPGMWLAAGILFLGCFECALAQDSSTCSGLLLKNNVSIRAEGMGGAQAGVMVDEAGALASNPAGLYGTKSQGVSTAYYKGLADESFGMLNFDTPIGTNWVSGASVLLYDGGMFDWNAAGGQSKRVPAERDALVALTGAYKLEYFKNPLILGANFKCLYATLLNQYSALAYAGDIGLRTGVGGFFKNVSFGLALKNVGTPLKYLEVQEPLPTYAEAGLAYRIPSGKNMSLLLAADGQYDLEKYWTGNAGAELEIFNAVALRAGYRQEPVLSGWSAGVGVTLDNLQIDYSFNMITGLNFAQRMGIKYMLGKNDPAAKEKEGDVVLAPDSPEPDAINPRQEVEKIIAKIIGIEKVGGRIAKVTVNVGSQKRIKTGFKGAIVDINGRPIGGVIVRQVEPEQSVAEVVGLGQSIELNCVVLIERPGDGTAEPNIQNNDQANNPEVKTGDKANKKMDQTATGSDQVEKGTSVRDSQKIDKPNAHVKSKAKPTPPIILEDAKNNRNVRQFEFSPKTGSGEAVGSALKEIAGNYFWEPLVKSKTFSVYKKIVAWFETWKHSFDRNLFMTRRVS